MGDLRGHGQVPPGRGSDGVFQISETNSSSPSEPVNSALRNLASLSSVSAPGSLNTNINAELLRRILSSVNPATTLSNPSAVESVESALRREKLRSMGGPEQNAQSNPLNALILNSASQLRANFGPTSGLNNCPPSGVHIRPVNGASRGPNDVPQTTADLSAEELHVVSLMRRRSASLQNASAVSESTTMPSIEQQRTILIQQQQAQQTRASAAADAGQQLSEQPSLEHLQLPSHRQSNELRLSESIFQLQRQLQGLAAVAGQQPSHQPTLENLRHQHQRESDRSILPDGLLQAQQQSQGVGALTGQQPSQQLTMEHMPHHHHLQQNDRAVLPYNHLQPRSGGLPLASLAEDASMPPAGSDVPTATSRSPRLRRQRKKEAFPGKLYRLLADVESQGNSHIVSFTPDGGAFKIHDPDAFMTDVAPNYFGQTRFTSFVRQLNLYGFDRVSHGHDRGAFIHPSFLRGRGDLASRIQRQTVPSRAKNN